MAVTGTADPAALLRIDAGQPGLPLSLTKPIGTGVLNAWHKATGQVSAAAIEVMTTLNGDASRWCAVCPRDQVRHRRDRVRPARPPVQAGPGQRGLRGDRPCGGTDHRRHPGGGAGRRHVPGGSRRNLDWVRPHADPGTWVRTTCSCSRTRKPLWRAARGRGAARSAGDRRAGPAARQRAHHPVARNRAASSGALLTSPRCRRPSSIPISRW